MICVSTAVVQINSLPSPATLTQDLSQPHSSQNKRNHCSEEKLFPSQVSAGRAFLCIPGMIVQNSLGLCNIPSEP